MTQFKVFKPYQDEPENTRFLYIQNSTNRAYFEAARDSNKGFKYGFLVVRAQTKEKRSGRVKLSCPRSWSRAHDEYGYKKFNLKPCQLDDKEEETFKLLEAWGERLKRGKKKFLSGEIIDKGAEVAEALKALLIEDFAPMKRVARCAKKVTKLSGGGLEKNFLLELLKENDRLRGTFGSLADVRSEFVAAKGVLEAGSMNVEEISRAATTLEEAQKLESEAGIEFASLQQQPSELESWR